MFNLSRIVMPTLEHLALVKTAVSLWYREDIRELTGNFVIPSVPSVKFRKWKVIEDKVKEKIEEISVALCLKQQLFCMIKPIGLQILSWMESNRRICRMVYLVNSLNQENWKPMGVVDKRKAAEVIATDTSIDINIRYKMACTYFLEDYVYDLSQLLDENQSLLNELDDLQKCESCLLSYWLNYINGGNNTPCCILKVARATNVMEFYSGLFEIVASNGNEVGARYFLEKFPEQIKGSILLRTAKCLSCSCILCGQEDTPKRYYSDVLFALLPAMTEEEKADVFANNPFQILMGFLDWPWDKYFMEALHKLWGFLPEKKCQSLFIEICNRINDGNVDPIYQNIFQNFWLEAPVNYRQNVIKDNCFWLLAPLIAAEDRKTIKVLLEALPFENKKAMHYDISLKTLYKNLIRDGRLYFVEFLLEAFAFPRKELIAFRKEMQLHFLVKSGHDKVDWFFHTLKSFDGDYISYGPINELIDRGNWNQFLVLIGTFIHMNDKRSGEPTVACPSKRICRCKA